VIHVGLFSDLEFFLGFREDLDAAAVVVVFGDVVLVLTLISTS
jgi:hypothetical protein